MAITEMIVPGLRRGSTRADRTDPNSAAAGCTASWTAWGTTAYVTVTDPSALPAARRLASRYLATAEKAAARFRHDAELHKLYGAGGRALTVSPMLADLIAAALIAAERTDGDVDPTVGAAMTAVHSPRRFGGRDHSGVPACGSLPTAGRSVPGWQQVDLRGRRLRVPAGTTLDLSATAKAVSCDRAAAQVRDRLGVGVLVGLGGDVASAGPAPDGGWPVVIGDRNGRPQAEVTLPAGAALATSHFTARPEDGGLAGSAGPVNLAGSADSVGSIGSDDSAGSVDGFAAPGHLIDPRTGREPAPVWRTASAIGFSSLEAATYTAAALVRGTSARAWLTQLWIPARLTTVAGDVITTGPWRLHDGNDAAIGDAVNGTDFPFLAPRTADAADVANSRRTTL